MKLKEGDLVVFKSIPEITEISKSHDSLIFFKEFEKIVKKAQKIDELYDDKTFTVHNHAYHLDIKWVDKVITPEENPEYFI